MQIQKTEKREKTGRRRNSGDAMKVRGLEETNRLLAALQKHQAELVSQNKELHTIGKELRASRDQYLDLFDQAPVPYITIDEKGVIKAANRKAEELFGVERSHLTSQSLSDFIAEEDMELFSFHRFSIDKNRGKKQSAELRMKRTDGMLFWADVESVALDTKPGEHRHIRSAIMDVTGRKELEEEREQRQRLEALGFFASGIAHDLNNMLHAIFGSLSILRMMSRFGEKEYMDLERAENACRLAKRLNNQLLLFSSERASERKNTPMQHVIRAAALPALSGTAVNCEFLLPGNLWPASVDTGRISQAFSNLVANGVQAMPEGGTFIIRGENVFLTRDMDLPLHSGRYLKISFQDHGRGIEEKDQGRIFDPYFSTTREGGGLGLAVTYSIVQQHGGYMRVRSRQGRGTTVELFLPACESERLETENLAGKPLLPGRGKVLVMDDEQMVASVAGQMLSYLGYDFEIARDGTEAVEIYARALKADKPFDLVIMDLTIPGGMGGKEAVRKLQRLNPRVKVVVSSGYSNDPVMSDFKSFGFCDGMPKPYSIHKLNRILHDNLKIEGDEKWEQTRKKEIPKSKKTATRNNR